MLQVIKRTVISFSQIASFLTKTRETSKNYTSNHGALTSQIQNCGVCLHGHHVFGCARVIPYVSLLKHLYDIQGVVDMCLVAVKRPAEVCWWKRICCALQCQSVAK